MWTPGCKENFKESNKLVSSRIYVNKIAFSLNECQMYCYILVCYNTHRI